MKNTKEYTANVDAPQFSFTEVQKVTGLSKSDLQNYGKYIPPAERAIGRGNRSLYSARNIFCFVVFDHLSRLKIPVSVAREWATTSFVMGDVAYAWFIDPGGDKSRPPIGIQQMEGGADFADAVYRRMQAGKAFAVIPTLEIFESVCRATGTAAA